MKRLVVFLGAVIVLVTGIFAMPAEAAYRKVPASLARAMAIGSGLGAGPAKCYQGGVSSNNANFGIVSKTQWGKMHRSECTLLDAAVAIVHYNGTKASWEMVDYFLSPDCASARANLKKFGASSKVIRDLIGDWPC